MGETTFRGLHERIGLLRRHMARFGGGVECVMASGRERDVCLLRLADVAGSASGPHAHFAELSRRALQKQHTGTKFVW